MRSLRTLCAAASALAALGALVTTSPAPAAATTPTYTVTVGSTGSWTKPDDTPASPFIDQDGTFRYAQAHSLYGATQGRAWTFYKGSTMDDATTDSAISITDTTAMCNNSPTGLTATSAPSGSSYSQRNFCDIVGVWVDPDTGTWYGLVHNEFTPQPFGDGLHYDAIDYASSTDHGATWTIQDHAITSPYSTTRGDTAAFPQQTYDYGDGDPRLLVDAASGYFYVFYGSRIVDKSGGWGAFYEHAARAPISGKMAKGTWQKWYAGAWTQPGIGGKESNMVPADATNPNGYTDPAKEYDPTKSGSISQQVAAGTMPATSPLFVMDVSYDAYLGLYIGEPQAVDQSGSAPQEIYATANLATQKWTKIGDTGSYHTASWYRWFLDPANRTSSSIVGKNLRAYCSFSCSAGSSSEYVNLTLGSSAPAAPVTSGTVYRISNAGGRVLAQTAGSSATTSNAAAGGADTWAFWAMGDGSYEIVNNTTGNLLGVDGTTNAGRAWGVAPTATGTTAASLGQQWWVVPNSSATDGSATGSFRLVNRYSGLVLALSSVTGRLSETTPVRAWTAAAGGVGSGRTASEQTLTLTAVGTATTPPPANLNGSHTLVTSGKALDDPNHSTTAGTQLITWALNGGANQHWQFTQQADGSYQLVNGESGLCVDVNGGSTAAGAKIIQWTCTSNANQHWIATPQSDGTYTLTSSSSGLLLTTASTSDGSLVTQQAASGSSLQRWTIG